MLKWRLLIVLVLAGGFVFAQQIVRENTGISPCKVDSHGDLSCPGDAGISGNFSNLGDFTLGNGCFLETAGVNHYNCSVLGGTNQTLTTGTNGTITTGGGGIVTSGANSGTNAFGVGTNGARVDFGAGANDYASSDGTTVTFAGPVAVPSNSTAAFQSPGAFTINSLGGLVQLEGTTALYWPSSSSAGYVTSNASAANTGATVGTALFKFYPQNALDSTDWVFSLATANNAASIFSVDYSGLVTTASGYAGVMNGTISGYSNNTSTHGVLTINGRRAKHTIPTGTVSRVSATIQTVGTTGGTFVETLFDVTSTQTIFTRTGISCTLSAGVTSADSTSSQPVAIGDDLELRIDASSCTGNNPIMNLDISW